MVSNSPWIPTAFGMIFPCYLISVIKSAAPCNNSLRKFLITLLTLIQFFFSNLARWISKFDAVIVVTSTATSGLRSGSEIQFYKIWSIIASVTSITYTTIRWSSTYHGMISNYSVKSMVVNLVEKNGYALFLIETYFHESNVM